MEEDPTGQVAGWGAQRWAGPRQWEGSQDNQPLRPELTHAEELGAAQGQSLFTRSHTQRRGHPAAVSI